MHEEARIPVRIYFLVFAGLLVLLFLSAGLSLLPTGEHHVLRDLLTAAGLAIAATKTVLIVLWFMHVRVASRLTWVFASVGFVWLSLLIGLTLTDYSARPRPIASPPIVLPADARALIDVGIAP